MSSRTVQVVGGPAREHAWVDAATNALLVKVVNPGGGSGTVVQYNEDTAHVSGDTGTMALVVRNDAGGSLVSADGDYAPLQVDATGALRVTGGGGGTQYQEDAAHTTGDTGTMALVVRQDTPGSLVGTDGDYAPLQVDATGRLRVAVDAAVALSVSNFPATQVVSDGGGSLTVDGTVTALQGTSPWVIGDGGGSLTVDGTVAATQSGVWTVAATQSGAWSVSVSNFPATTTVVQPTHDNLNANANLQIGDADVGALNPVPVSDNGSSLTVDGTVAVSSVAGTVTVTGTVAATQSGAWTVGVNNFPAVQPVNDNGGSLTVDGTVAVSAVGGTVAVTQSGAWSVGVTAVTPGTGATDLGKAEDAVHASGDVGVMALAVRNDVDGALAADGDYHPLVVDSGGRLKVSLEGTTVTVDGTVAVTQTTSPWVVGQATHASLNAQVRLQDRDSSSLLSVLVADVAAVFPMTETGVLPLFLVTDDPTAVGGNFTFGRMNEAGAIYVTATGGNLAVTQATSPWVVGDGGGSLTVDGTVAISGTVAVTQSGAWSVSISALTPGTGATNLGKAEDAAHTTGDVGVMALAVRNDGETSLAGTSGDYTPVQLNATGRLKVNTLLESGDSSGLLLAVYQATDSLASARTQGTTLMFETSSGPSLGIDGVWQHPFIDSNDGGILAHITNFGSLILASERAEDSAHVSGHLGIMSLAVRRDTLSSTTSANNDYATFNVDSVGALWVREYGVTTVVLSGSTRGRPIQITGTTSGAANTLHTATTTTGQLDRVFIWLTNTSTAAVTVTIEFGTTGAGNELDIIVPANETVLAVDGAVLGGAATDTIKAYASTGSVVNAFGRVERLAA